ncbi:hypothetical protein [Spirosoma aerolatum]|uniref:hypothetical protein n=1 Tax=Spirosoma aerolatum TaxID=1211326 RepID=UPI0009ABDC14|nr:hypothetical protein [Spirosoma aerolatum]
MIAILDQLDRIADIDLEQVCEQTVMQHEAQITDFNRKQLDKGLRSDGSDLGQYSSIKYKGRLRPVDLDLTGAFRDSFQVDPETGGFIINATDSKTEKLQTKYGEDILGVPDQDEEEVGEWLQDALITEIDDRI